MKNLYQIKENVVICSITGDLPTDSEVCLPVSSLIFGMKGSFCVSTGNEKSEGSCFYIPAEITYKVTPIDCKGFVIIFFDIISSEHYFLSTKYGNSKITKLNLNANEKLLSKASVKMNEITINSFLEEVFIVQFNIERRGIHQEYDERIIVIDEYVRKNIKDKLSNKDLAAKIHLSESRFYHFFKEQTQVNVSRYILWLRLKSIFNSHFKNEGKLTALLGLTNFTDLPHLIKAFKSFFGESPKRLLNK